ncbi:heme peroxidase [Rhodococcus sp. 3Y1]
MTISTDTVDAVAAACRDRLGDPSAWVASDAYRQSLALCIIESVQSTSGHSEVTVVDRYLAYRKAREDKPVTDGARELLRTFEEAGSSDQWAGKIGSYKRRYTATGVPIEARHIQQVAEKLHHLRINSVEDLLSAADSDNALEAVHHAWVDACGDGSEVTWAHLLMLAEFRTPIWGPLPTPSSARHSAPPSCRETPRRSLQLLQSNSEWIRTDWTTQFGGGCPCTVARSNTSPEYL